MTSEHLTVTLRELQSEWSFADMLDAHEALDQIDEIVARARAAAT
jgi:hypothetical protein